MNTSYPISDHNVLINETDRTTIGLLWHENVIDVLDKMPVSVSAPFYKLVLDNICQADYFDRITFQNQIWLLMSFRPLLKHFTIIICIIKHFRKRRGFILRKCVLRRCLRNTAPNTITNYSYRICVSSCQWIRVTSLRFLDNEKTVYGGRDSARIGDV